MSTLELFFRRFFLSIVVLSSCSYVEAASKASIPMAIVYSFRDVKEHLDKSKPETLFCINVDNLIQHQYLGSSGWQNSRLHRLYGETGSFEQARKQVEREQVVIDTFTKREVLEANFSRELEDLIASSSCSFLGVSSYGSASVLSMLKNLKNCGLDFGLRAFSTESCFLDSEEKCSATPIMQDGVLFCNALGVAGALKQLFIHENVLPKHIIYLSDDPEQIKAIGKAFIGLGTSFLGLVYYPASERFFSYVFPYSSAAELQERQALKVISDATAKSSLEYLQRGENS